MKQRFFLIIIVWAGVITAQETDTSAIANYFRGHIGAIVVYNNNSGKYFRYNAKRCAQRFLPASTFKIPNSLIGLETGVIPDENYVIKRDGVERSIKEWNRNHTLATAIQFSVVPYYQELARRVGRDRYNDYLKKINYGNETIGDRVDYFWLDNSLKISANEQVDFMKKFYEYKLPFSKRSVNIVKKIIPEEKYANSILKFKTGGGEKEDGTWIGWLVGYVERKNNIYFYAFNAEGKTFEDVADLRNKASREILKYLKIIE